MDPISRDINKFKEVQSKSLPSVQETVKEYTSKPSYTMKEKFFTQQKFNLVCYNILPPDDPIYRETKEKISSLNFDNEIESKCMAILVGSIIGDALGATQEFSKFDREKNDIKDFVTDMKTQKGPSGQWTDDGACALCLADSLISNNLNFDGIDMRHRFFLWYFEGYNNGLKNETSYYFSPGSGRSMCDSFMDFLKSQKPYVFGLEIENINNHLKNKPYDQQGNGNGSLMRLAPVPIAFHKDLNKAMEIAEKSSNTTHDGLEAADLCRLVTFLAIKLMHCKKGNLQQELPVYCQEFAEKYSKNQAVKYLALSKKEEDFSPYKDSKFNKSLEDRNWNWMAQNFNYSQLRIQLQPKIVGGYSMDSVAMSLHLLFYSNNFSEPIQKCASMGGDADSVAAVLGILAGAYYGFNQEVQHFYNGIQKWDDEITIAARALKLYQLANKL